MDVYHGALWYFCKYFAVLYIITMVHEFLYHDKYLPSLYQCTLCNGFHACFNCKRYHGTIKSFDICYDTSMAFFKVLWCVM